jgi:hypothetical protein
MDMSEHNKIIHDTELAHDMALAEAPHRNNIKAATEEAESRIVSEALLAKAYVSYAIASAEHDAAQVEKASK